MRGPSLDLTPATAHGRWFRAAKVTTVALFFLVLAYAGYRGQRPARRQADLAEILLCRDSLQDALDAQRSAACGPTPKGSAARAPSLPGAIGEWAFKIKRRLADFRSTYAPVSRAEDMDLRLSAATLALAEHGPADALAMMDTRDEPVLRDPPSTRDLEAEVLRVRADARYDGRDWSSALDLYREVLLRQRKQLGVLERVAECLHSLGQTAEALDAYTELASRLHERGTRLLAQMDSRSAVQDLNKAATIRLWLFEQGRRGVAADLAQSFASCARASIELQDHDTARVYFAHALDIQTQLIGKEHRNDLASELASNHVGYAGVLLEVGKPEEALAHLSHAIDIVSQLVSQGQPELRRKLAPALAQRGLVRQARGQKADAARDFEKAAEVFGLMGDFSEAAAWQEKSLFLSGPDARQEAQSRLDHYRSGKPYPGSR